MGTSEAAALAGWSMNRQAPVIERLAASKQALDYFIARIDELDNQPPVDVAGTSGDHPFSDLVRATRRMQASPACAYEDHADGYSAAAKLVSLLQHVDLDLVDELLLNIAKCHTPNLDMTGAPVASIRGAEWGVRFSAGSDPVEFDTETDARDWLALQGCPTPLMRRDEDDRWQYVDGPPKWGYLTPAGVMMEFASEQAVRRWPVASPASVGIIMHRDHEDAPWLPEGFTAIPARSS